MPSMRITVALSLPVADTRASTDNLINGTAACENDALLNKLLKTEVSLPVACSALQARL